MVSARSSILTLRVKDQDKYVHEVILPRYNDILPKDKLQ